MLVSEAGARCHQRRPGALLPSDTNESGAKSFSGRQLHAGVQRDITRQRNDRHTTVPPLFMCLVCE